MRVAPMGEKPTNPHAKEANDLTVIKGIGLVRQQWLQASLNVFTFQDLAGLTADEIESRLRAEGQIASRGEVEKWIAQAQELAATNDLSPRQVVDTVEAEVGEQANSLATEGQWKPFASFVVEFQARESRSRTAERRTTVHYMEADRSKTWPGIEGERLCQWMLQQVGERVQREPESEKKPSVEELRAAVPPTAAQPAEVKISEIRAFQPPQAETLSAISEAGQPFLGFIRGDEIFALEAAFELAAQAAGEVVKGQRAYRAQFYAHGMSTGTTTHLGDTEPGNLVENQLSYTATLPEATLPPGLYRLQVLTKLEGPYPILTHLEIPLLQVV